MRTGKGNYGFDAAVSRYVDLVEAGIIDPTKVVRVALENAVSVASVLLLTEATLTELPEEKQEGARAAGLPETLSHGGGGGVDSSGWVLRWLSDITYCMHLPSGANVRRRPS